MVRHTQTNRRQIADDLFECVSPFFRIYKGTSMNLPELNCDAEEADTRIIPHLHKISLNQNASAVVSSNHTDVCVLLFHFMYTLRNNGLSELWMRYGTGNAQ